MGSDAQLASVGEGDLVYGLSSGLVNKSLHARLQVATTGSYDLQHPG